MAEEYDTAAWDIPDSNQPREYRQEDVADFAQDLLLGMNGLPAFAFMRHGRQVAWYDELTGTYRDWKQSDNFDRIVLARTKEGQQSPPL